MTAFHNDHAIKVKYINRLKDHYKADEFIKGMYWQNGKGCAVGCTIHSDNHLSYETELGIPQVIARLEDAIFERLPNELAKEFPLQFLSAINVGADLAKVWNYFAIWLLTDEKYGILQHVDNKKVIQDIADAYAEDITTPVTVERWKELRDSTASAYSASAYSGADATAAYYSAAYAFADYATDYATDAAYAYSAAAYAATDSGADKNLAWYVAASKKLIELLTETL